MALTDKLTAIADGFRTSRGTSDKYTLEQMATLAAEPIGGGGGGDLPAEAFNISGECSYRFHKGGWDWFINAYGNRITTKTVTALDYMFNQSGLDKIPFTINITDASNFNCTFNNNDFIECPKVRGSIKMDANLNMTSVIVRSTNIRDFEDLFEPSMIEGFADIVVKSSSTYPKVPSLFSDCYSLRRLPSWFYKLKLSEDSTAFPPYHGALYYNMTYKCYALDEAVDIPVWRCQAGVTSSMFSNTFAYLGKVNKITFETNEGQPIVTNWAKQTIKLDTFVGYASSKSNMIDYNSGLTTDTQVTNATTYQALKDNPDWWPTSEYFSRYNHDSAVETINSLPDTSAYVSTVSNGTNTIQFKGNCGRDTDGGAINTLTAEEIAVATAKGWTVTFK
jgi:hypothetical protein